MLKIARESTVGVPIAEAPGVGDRSIWGANAEGALWVVQKGRYMLNVTAAGELANPSALREPLRRLAAQGVGRL